MSPGRAAPALLLYFAAPAAHFPRLLNHRAARWCKPRWCWIRTVGRSAERS